MSHALSYRPINGPSVFNKIAKKVVARKKRRKHLEDCKRKRPMGSAFKDFIRSSPRLIRRWDSLRNQKLNDDMWHYWKN